MSQTQKPLTDIEVANLKERLRCYAVEKHEPDLREILQEGEADEHYSVTVNALSLFESCMTICYSLCNAPLLLLPIFDAALIEAQTLIYEQLGKQSDQSVKPYVHARITSLPVQPEFTRVSVPKTSDVGNFLALTGTIIRSTNVRVLEYEKDYICNKCKAVITQKADLVQYNTVGKPAKCTNDVCNSPNFTLMADKGGQPVKCRNYQEVKVQEQVQRLAMGTIPRSLWVVLEDDLADVCKAGDDVIVCGTVLRRWRHLATDNKCDIELVLKANSVIITNEQRNSIAVTQELREEIQKFWEEHELDPLTARNHILSSLCPQVYGLYVVKLAVAMVLAGGVQRHDESGTCVRGEIHMLLVGDPGTGKSQFLKYASKITPRSVLTTGIGSTSAGLTVTAVKDGGEWQLEAGALVLADGGLCCIDEFNSIREHDKASIHEAMEQQTISVAKAGMVCKLNTKTTILAATNPKGQYDPNESLTVNIALASPLLSRFDIVLVLLDTQNEHWDRVVSNYILEDKHPVDLDDKRSVIWSMDKMQAYISLIKSIDPELTTGATRVLRQYYHAQRCSDDRNAARTTMRLLQSMIRLSQAHARLMFRNKVTVLDAVVAVTIMESSMQGAALLSGVNALHTAFPDEAEEEYLVQAKMILERLCLPDLLEDEIRIYQDLEQKRKSSVSSSSLSAVVATTTTAGATTHTVMSERLDNAADSSKQDEEHPDDTHEHCNSQSAVEWKSAENNQGIKQETDMSTATTNISNDISVARSDNISEHDVMENHGMHRTVYSVTNPGHDLSNISLSDMLNSSSDDTVNSCQEFPQVGSSLGFVSQGSHNSGTKLESNNLRILPSNTSTPVRLHKLVDKQTKDSNIKLNVDKDRKLKNNEVKSNLEPPSKTVIRQTIENRLTQISRKPLASNNADEDQDDFMDNSIGKSYGPKLVYVRDKKSKHVGQDSIVPLKVKKAIFSGTGKWKKKGKLTEDEINADDVCTDVCESLVETDKVNGNTKKREIQSGSDGDGDCVSSSGGARKKYQKRQKRCQSKGTPMKSNYEHSRIRTTPCSSAAIDLNGTSDLPNSAARSVSASTLSKLRKFQFDDSKSSALNYLQSDISKSLLSRSLWTNGDTQDGDGQHAIALNVENVNTKKSGDKSFLPGVRLYNSDQQQRMVIPCTISKDNSEEECKEKSCMQKNHDKQYKYTTTASPNESKMISPLNLNSPSWLVTLNKKFASPSITNTDSNTILPSTDLSVADGKCDELDDMDLEESSFLTKLQTTNYIKRY